MRAGMAMLKVIVSPVPVPAAQSPAVVSAAAFTLAIASRRVHLPLPAVVLSAVVFTAIVAADAAASGINTIMTARIFIFSPFPPDYELSATWCRMSNQKVVAL